MSLVVHAGRLHHEMVRRGWAAADLARQANLSPATIGAALAGRPISARSLAGIAKALSSVPASPSIDLLILDDGQELG